MAIRTLEEVKRDILKQPVVEGCEFKLGDKVTFTNDYGVEFDGMSIIGFDDGSGITFKYGSHIYLDGSAYWSPHKESQLTLESRLSDEAYQERLNE